MKIIIKRMSHFQPFQITIGVESSKDYDSLYWLSQTALNNAPVAVMEFLSELSCTIQKTQ